MYGRYTELSNFAKQFAASQREGGGSGRQRSTLNIREAKRRKNKAWREFGELGVDVPIHERVEILCLHTHTHTLPLSPSPCVCRVLELALNQCLPLHPGLDVCAHPRLAYGAPEFLNRLSY